MYLCVGKSYLALRPKLNSQNTRSMQGVFGVSVSELYLLMKALINIERTVDLCLILREQQILDMMSQAWL